MWKKPPEETPNIKIFGVSSGGFFKINLVSFLKRNETRLILKICYLAEAIAHLAHLVRLGQKLEMPKSWE